MLAAITLKRHAAALDVTVVRSKEIGVIGVGEGSTVGFPRFLHTYLAIDPAEFYRLARADLEARPAVRRWGPRERFNYSFAAAYRFAGSRFPSPRAITAIRTSTIRTFTGADERRPRVSAPARRHAAASRTTSPTTSRTATLSTFWRAMPPADRRDAH